MSCPLINNNTGLGCCSTLNLNRICIIWPLQWYCKIYIFCAIFHVFCKSCRTRKVITLQWAAQMSCALINNNTGLGCCSTLNLNRICIIWPLQWCCKMYIFCAIFHVFCKSCRTRKVITLPWDAQMSCPLINNNTGLRCCCTLNLNRICIIWPLQWCCKIYIFLWNFFTFFVNSVGLERW